MIPEISVNENDERRTIKISWYSLTIQEIIGMKNIGNMKVYSWDEVQDELFGKPGTPEREEYEKGCKEHLDFYKFLKSADIPNLWEKHREYLNLAKSFIHEPSKFEDYMNKCYDIHQELVHREKLEFENRNKPYVLNINAKWNLIEEAKEHVKNIGKEKIDVEMGKLGVIGSYDLAKMDLYKYLNRLAFFDVFQEFCKQEKDLMSFIIDFGLSTEDTEELYYAIISSFEDDLHFTEDHIEFNEKGFLVVFPKDDE